MPMEVLEELVKCPLCGVEVGETQMRECNICHCTFCQYCALNEYGKVFCSKRCRGFFFFGDGDNDERDF